MIKRFWRAAASLSISNLDTTDNKVTSIHIYNPCSRVTLPLQTLVLFIARSTQAGRIQRCCRKSIFRQHEPSCIPLLKQRKTSCLTFGCAHLSFWEITDSSVLCVTWIHLQNFQRSLGKVQDAVDQRGCRHILRCLNRFLQRHSESG